MPKKINIAIDGHSSTGKSTLAKSLARKLGYTYLDSGAMYRAVTLYALRNNLIGPNGLNEEELISSLKDVQVDFVRENGDNLTRLNEEIVESEIRGMEVSEWVSAISKVPEVRGKLRVLQQKAAKKGGIVMDGRDIGSAVLPKAELKIFMTADAEIRALRRFDELKQKGLEITLEEVKRNIANRDKIDSERQTNPLIQVSDALLLDNSHLSSEEQLEIALNWAREKIEAKQHQ